MVKYILAALIFASLIGCVSQPVKTVYQEKDIPIYIVPAPPIVKQPVLAITSLTPAQQNNIGELTKAYNISLKQTMQYACQLKNIVDEYTILAASSPSLISPVPLPVAMSFSLSTPSISQILSVIKPNTPLTATVPTITPNVAKDCNK
jgi:hypothetical protein